MQFHVICVTPNIRNADIIDYEISLLLLTTCTIFSGVVNRRACLRDVIITNFYMAEWAVLAVKAACNYFPF